MIYYMYNHKADEISMNGVEGERVKCSYVMMHYCEHCHTETRGIWEFDDVDIEYCYDYGWDYFNLNKKKFHTSKLPILREAFLNGKYLKSERDCKRYASYKEDDWPKREKKYIDGTYKNLIGSMGAVKQVLKYRDECISFVGMEKCPVCGKPYSKESKFHPTNLELGTYEPHELFMKGPTSNMIRSHVPHNIWMPTVSWKMGTLIPGELTDVNQVIRPQNCCPVEGMVVETKNGTGTILDIRGVEKDIWVQYYDEKSLESTLDYFKAYYMSGCKNSHQIDGKYERFIEKCEDSFVPAKIQPLDFKANELKTYLSNAVNLEKNIYTISQRLKELYTLEYYADKEAMASEHILVMNKPKPEHLLKAYEELKVKNPAEAISLEDFPVRCRVSEPKKPEEPTDKPIMPELEKPGLFNKKSVNERNAQLTTAYGKKLQYYEEQYKQYEQAMADYNLAYGEYKKALEEAEKEREVEYTTQCEKIRQEHKQQCEAALADYEKYLEDYNAFIASAKDISTPEKVKQSLIKQEIHQAEELIEKLYHARNELYAYDIVFIKYRNLVAVSTFYEYIMAGRCETLEGTNGAYNIYENEIRMNTVIAQLTEVVASLEEIKNSQYMIYSAITESNRQLRSLNYSMDNAVDSLRKIESNSADMSTYLSNISDNTEVIAYNTAATAFYAKKNAELTDALGFMVALG